MYSIILLHTLSLGAHMATDGRLNLGYACINETLKKQNIRINRTFKKATLNSKGLAHAANIAEQNLKGLYKLLHWNVEHNIKLFRLSSDMFSWGDTYGIHNLPNIAKLRALGKLIGDYTKKHGIRLSSHPGQFCCLASPNEDTVVKAIQSLNFEGDIMDLLQQPLDHRAKINIHLGGVYGDKAAVYSRFLQAYELLDDCVKLRLTVENDDKASMYTTKELYDNIFKPASIPVVFDFHHHSIHNDGMPEQEALEMALATWPAGIRATTHYSESAQLERTDVRIQAHSFLIYSKIPDHGLDFDVMIEAKGKELALLNHRKLWGSV